jgi:hypothetical protein
VSIVWEHGELSIILKHISDPSTEDNIPGFKELEMQELF